MCNRTDGGVHLLHSEKGLAVAAADQAWGLEVRAEAAARDRRRSLNNRHAHTAVRPCFLRDHISSYKTSLFLYLVSVTILFRLRFLAFLLFFSLFTHCGGGRAAQRSQQQRPNAETHEGDVQRRRRRSGTASSVDEWWEGRGGAARRAQECMSAVTQP